MRFFILIFILISITVLAGYISSTNIKSTGPSSEATASVSTVPLTDEIDKCEKLGEGDWDSYERNDCFAALALERNNAALCGRINEGDYQDPKEKACYINLAIKYKNKGYCEASVFGWEWEIEDCKEKVN